ncbi:MoaD/ThiS family protein [Streptomyces clavuligerus]|nr:MoaD/ThiS family protein [Streptomyces clavuligerus]WDN56733.1 MoaD/ThiS family protein [Streptomyces clavuligerus]
MTLCFSGLLLRLVDYQRTIEVDAATLGEALDQVEGRHPRLRTVLRDGEGGIRRSHRVFVNGELVGAADLATPLADSDSVEFLTAIAGG